MIIKQLSVFLENRSGRLSEMTKLLAKENINLSALSSAETSEYGIIRTVVSEPEKAKDLLQQNNFSVSLTDIICLNMPNKPGSLAEGLDILSQHDISVEYMYAFSHGEEAFAIIKTDNLIETVSILEKEKLDLLQAEELYNI